MALDMHYSKYQSDIPELLNKGTNESIDRCIEILEWIINTIRELFDVTHSSANTSTAILEEIENYVKQANPEECPPTLVTELHKIGGQIEAIIAWVNSRHKIWAAYHGFTHAFLRNIVRIDRDKKVSDALARSITCIPDWSLVVSSPPKLISIEENETEKIKREPIKREKPSEGTDTTHKKEKDITPILEGIFLEELESGEARLSSVLRQGILRGLEVREVGYRAPTLMARMITDTKIDFDINDIVEVMGSARVEELTVRKI